MKINIKNILVVKRKLSPIYLLLFSITVFSADSIDSAKLNKIVSDKSFNDVILDVRTPFEWKETGVIKGAITINAYDSNLEKRLKKLDKSKEYYVYCYSGVRSSKVLNLMRRIGVKGINISDGISGWKKNQFPLTKYQRKSGLDKILER